MMTDNKSKNMSQQLAEARREIESLKAADTTGMMMQFAESAD
ncbi:hypothetical protein [Shewanella algae]